MKGKHPLSYSLHKGLQRATFMSWWHEINSVNRNGNSFYKGRLVMPMVGLVGFLVKLRVLR